MEKIRTLIVDDHPVVREGLRTMLSTDQTVEIVGEACDGNDAVAMVAEKKPDVVLMDIRMPNLDGIEATRRIKDEYPDTSIVLLTMYDNDAYIIDAVRGRASGYLLKDASRELVLHTIRAAASGASLLKTNVLYQAISSPFDSEKAYPEAGISATEGMVPLTSREQQVLRLVAAGYSNKEIGKNLGIAEHTAKKHMQNILAKLHATSRIGAVNKAARAAIIK